MLLASKISPPKIAKVDFCLSASMDSEENFDQNCRLLYNKQTPIFLKDGGERVTKLEK
jgi:hypothetical protein